MSKTDHTQKGTTVSVRNIGGINDATVDLTPGVNILAGRNATNRTSFLQAIMAALGSNDVTMKGDAEEAEVTLEYGESIYRRQLNRRNQTVSFSGDSYLEDPELADLFAFLLESNEARQAVTSGQTLRDLIMRPVDLAEIKSEISRLESEKTDVDEEIESIEQRKQALPDLEAQRNQLQSEIEETRAELTEKEAEIDEVDGDVQTQREEQQKLEEKLEALREARNDLEDVRYDLDNKRESIESLKQDRSTLREELDTLPETPQNEIEHLESEINRLRERRRRLDSEINSLQSTVQFNEEMISDERSEVYEAMTDDDRHATDELLEEEIVCWTCGTKVERDQIEGTVDDLRGLRQEKLDAKREVSGELEELKTDKDVLDKQQQRRDDFKRQLSQVENELGRREDRVEELQQRRSELEDQVKDLEAEVEELESDQFDAILDLHREANQLEYDLGRLEKDREDIEAEIESIESRIEDIDELQAKRERIQNDLTELRTRVETLEEEAVEAFNEHIKEVLGALDYENIDRIWIERVQREVREGRQKAIKTFFELHVVRSTPSGTTYEDTIDHLSESESEVVGLVFALAGYLVHEVYEDVPFMLLDSLESIDSGRIAELIEYFSEFTDFLVVALLEEDADAIEGDHSRIESI